MDLPTPGLPFSRGFIGGGTTRRERDHGTDGPSVHDLVDLFTSVGHEGVYPHDDVVPKVTRVESTLFDLGHVVGPFRTPPR